MEDYHQEYDPNHDQYDPQPEGENAFRSDELRPEENLPQNDAQPEVQQVTPNQILYRDTVAKSNIYPQQIVSPLKYSNIITQPVFTSTLPVVQGFNQIATQTQPVVQTQLVGQTQIVGQAQLPQTQFLGTQLVSTTQTKREAVKGESRIEYVPYEKTIVEYEAVQRTEYVPKEKKITDYYAVEYQTEYIPQVYQDKYIEYVPQERVTERVEYQAVQRQIVHKPQETVQQAQVVQAAEVVQQPVVTQQVVQQPVVSQQIVQQPVVTQQFVQQPVVTQQYVQQPVVTQQYVQQPVQYVSTQQVIQKPVQYIPQQFVQQVPQANSDSRIVTVQNQVPLGATSFAATSVYQNQLAGSIMYPSKVQRLPPVLQNSSILPPQGLIRTTNSPTFLQQSFQQPVAQEQEKQKKKEKKGFLEALFD